MEEQKHIVSFSGGKDSTAMLLKMIELDMQIDRIICVDTTKEFPEMYDHIEKVKEYIRPYGYSIDTIDINFDYWFGEHIKTKGKNKGSLGYSWPDFRNRWCTALKQEAVIGSVYCNSLYNSKKRGQGKRIAKNIIEYHGISFEEKDRLNKNRDGRTIFTPLVDWEMTGTDCIQYCYSKGFDWGDYTRN